MTKDMWFLKGSRGSGRTLRLLCEIYENKIAYLQHKVDTLQGFLDHDIEYDMDKTIQEQKIKIEELENENTELKTRLKEHESIGNAQFWKNVWSWKTKADQLTKATEIVRKFWDFVNDDVEFDPEHSQEHTDLWNKLCEEAEQFLNSEVGK